MRVLITAGPTREYIDSVRFISNPSTGKLGYYLAEAFVKAGDKVILVSGPTHLLPPKGVNLIKVLSALQMYKASISNFDKVDVAISTAAVSDYTPAKKFIGKIKKEHHSIYIKLVRTKDILLELARRKKNQILVGFAMEVQNKIKNAIKKLKEKNLDMIVLNTPETFGSEFIKPIIVYRDLKKVKYKKMKKMAFSRLLVRIIKNLWRRK